MNESLNNFVKIEEIGRGASGVCYLSKSKLNYKDKKAIKEIITTRMTSNDLREVQNEIKILQILKSKYIIKYYDFKKLKNKIQILLEYAENGSMKDYLFNKKNNRNEEIVKKWISQILFALKELSLKNIIHRDIKSDNIFLDKNMNIKLGDFGVSKISKEYSKTFVGTPYYISPEIINGEKYNYKTDIWSLGIMIYEIINLKYPFEAPSIPMLAFKILKGKFEKPKNNYSKELNEFCYSMLIVNQKERPSIDQLMGFSLIKNIIDNEKQNNTKSSSSSNIFKKKFKINSVNNLKYKNSVNKNSESKYSESKNSIKKSKNEIIKKEEIMISKQKNDINLDANNLLNLVGTFENKLGNSSIKFEEKEKKKEKIKQEKEIQKDNFIENQFDFDGFTISKSQLIDITEEYHDEKKVDELLYSKKKEFGEEKFTLLYQTIITYWEKDENQNFFDNEFEKKIYDEINNKNNNYEFNYNNIKEITNLVINNECYKKLN